MGGRSHLDSPLLTFEVRPPPKEAPCLLNVEAVGAGGLQSKNFRVVVIEAAAVVEAVDC